MVVETITGTESADDIEITYRGYDKKYYVKTLGGRDYIHFNYYDYSYGDGSVVIIGANALGKENVTVSDGYTLALDSDVISPETTDATWTLGDNYITYKNAITSTGYKLEDNQIIYVAASGGEDLFTIVGLNSTVGVNLQDQEITLTEEALENSLADTITISDGYTLNLASGVDTVNEDLSTWSTLDGGKVAYLAGGTGEYYSLSNGNTVTYNASVAGANTVELSGVKGNPGIGDGTFSLTASNFAGNASVVSNTGNYKFALSGDLIGKSFTASGSKDTIINSSANVTIAGGTGDDDITNGSNGKNVLFAYKDGDGNDSIVGFNET